MSNPFAGVRRKPIVDEEEYIKYLMFLSEAVQGEDEKWDEEIRVPELAHLINNARDMTIRPYYYRGLGAASHYFSDGDLPPISHIRQTSAKLPYLEPSPSGYISFS